MRIAKTFKYYHGHMNESPTSNTTVETNELILVTIFDAQNTVYSQSL